MNMNSIRRAALLLGLILSLGILPGCATDRQVIAQADQVHGSIKPAVITDPELANYLQQVGNRVIDVARELHAQRGGSGEGKSRDDSWMFSQDMKFHFVNSKTLNAFTTGGEHMYIYTGLFEQCKSEDELAAVVAHEYAHVYARHVHKGMNRQLTALAVAAAAGGAGYALAGEDNRAQGAALGAGLGFAGAQFANMGFTRKDEAEADKLGFYFYTRAGWDPNRFGDFFQQMIDKGYDKTPAYLSDHPSLKSRVEEARRRAAELPPSAKDWRRAPVADPAKFRQLQQRSVAVGKTMPTDKTLANSQELLQALPRSCVAPVDPDEAMQARERIAQRAQVAAEGQVTMAEFDFIHWIRSQQKTSDFVQLAAGDDLAILKWKPDDLLLVGVDQVLDGVHFDSDSHAPRAIGTKAMNRNLSDCAAMACLPAAAMVSVALPRGRDIEYAKELYSGVKQAGEKFDCQIVGGETGSWDGRLAITVAILGRSAGVTPITRGGAKPQQWIYVSGPLGGSRAARHMNVEPRITLARELAGQGLVSAMIDISDGLSRDLWHICQESGIGAVIAAESIPVHEDALAARRDGRLPLDHALHDGEDYELLFTSDREDIPRVTRIGYTTGQRGIWLIRDGKQQPLEPSGWEHQF